MGKIIDKLLSGRYFSTLAVITTYCLMIFSCIYLTVLGKLTVETLLGIFTGFTTLATMVIKSYFERSDRPKEEQNA